MSGKITVELEVKNQKGIHARAASAFVKTVEQFNADVEVSRIGQTVGGCSIMGLMMLAASKGTTIEVSASGKQSKEVIDALTQLMDNKFGED
ncbi:MAG: HPr family phosphocarrier protein [Alphaproteobacteria bacterium]|nr:HPr family phosphocarrier protein [Alphaproteobacteria bacterium]